MGEQNNFTRRMFIKGVATSFGALPVFAWPRWAQAFYYNLGFFKKNQSSSLYVEDVFSTYLYTPATTSTETRTTGIDLATTGGMVWTKRRDATLDHFLSDSLRGAVNILSPNSAGGSSVGNRIESFTATGFTGTDNAGGNFASWTFRKAAKFFDVVTWTGNGVSLREISHNLGVQPGLIIVKRMDIAADWSVWHRSSGYSYGYGVLNTAAAFVNTGFDNAAFGHAVHSNTTFTLGNGTRVSDTNTNAATYVAYLFAHDTAADGLIQCGSYVGNSSVNGPIINLGWGAQFVMIKDVTGSTGYWCTFDNMRGMSASPQNTPILTANTTNSESVVSSPYIQALATGFQPIVGGGTYGSTQDTHVNFTGNTYIYMAIRRGPMKKPTSGTQVMGLSLGNNVTTAGLVAQPGFSPDVHLLLGRTATADPKRYWVNYRVTGPNQYLVSHVTDAEATGGGRSTDKMDGVYYTGTYNFTTNVVVDLRRAPGFFDTVCYTGDGVSNRQISHSLGAIPEMIIVKRRDGVGEWVVYHSGLDTSIPALYSVLLNSTGGSSGNGQFWGGSQAGSLTSAYFIANPTTGGIASQSINTSNNTYISYLFASCPGVSKVGTYTGAATDVTVSCGFSGQPRFVLVKRKDAAGDWIVVDSARGTSVYLTLNTMSDETSAIVITFTTGGFVAKAGTVANAASGANYIFLAIA